MAMGTSSKVGKENKTEEQVMKLRGQVVGKITYMNIEITKD